MQRADDSKADAQPAETISALEAAFERRRRAAGVVLAPLAFAAVHLTSASLGPQGQMMAAILAAVAVLWISETLPLPVTALLGAVLCIVLGVAPARQVLAYFADPIVFLFIGSFMLARAMMVHGLDRRIALSFLSLPWSQRFARAHARRARVRDGRALDVGEQHGDDGDDAADRARHPGGAAPTCAASGGWRTGRCDAAWPFATGMMLMVAYAACIGGIGTPVGSPPNLIGIG